MLISRLFKGMGKWCKMKLRKVTVFMNRGLCMMRMRRTLSRVINMRDMSVRHRSDLSKTLETLIEMIDGCGCGEHNADDDNDDPQIESRNEEEIGFLPTTTILASHAGVNATMKTTPMASIEIPALAEMIFCDHLHGNQEKMEQVDQHDHEYVHEYDVPCVWKTEKPSVSEIQIEHKDVKGTATVVVEEEIRVADDKKKSSIKCDKCKRHAVIAECLEAAVADINESVRAMNKYIIESVQHMACLDSMKKRGRKNRSLQGRGMGSARAE